MVTPCVGVWIETSPKVCNHIESLVTPCVGVWIETFGDSRVGTVINVTPCVGVWIETYNARIVENTPWSHPAWVCGLKPERDRVYRYKL